MGTLAAGHFAACFPELVERLVLFGPISKLAKELRPHLDDIEGFLSIERFASVQRPGWVLSASFWRDEEAATAWHEQLMARLHGMHEGYRWRLTEVERDYGMFSREEAPQYYLLVASV